MSEQLRIVVLGLSITSSWGNGHATNFRALVQALAGRGHDVLFLERDVPWYAEHRDLPAPAVRPTALYGSLDELRAEHEEAVAGSRPRDRRVVRAGGRRRRRWVQDAARGVKAFYDIDTPVTLAALGRGECEYLVPELVPGYDLYLSFTGGPTLTYLEEQLGSPRARAFYCLVDETRLRAGRRGAPVDAGLPRHLERGPPAGARRAARRARRGSCPRRRSSSRVRSTRPTSPGRRTCNASSTCRPPSTPASTTPSGSPSTSPGPTWCAPAGRPSVRLFEAAACGVPVVSDWWEGLDSFFDPGSEILVARSAAEVVQHLGSVDEERRAQIGAAARARVLAEHTAEHRVDELEEHVAQVREQVSR
jgi:spore maturation protein CgeB